MDSKFSNYHASMNSFGLIFFLLGIPWMASAVLDNSTDMEALLDFKLKITSDPLGSLRSWNTSLHFCQWHGITCSRQRQRVVGINLMSQKLAGRISPYIGNLSVLTSLNLENNSFIHRIPAELGHLRRLKSLLLRNNSIEGEIPASISGCTELVQIRVSFNNLGGALPWELGSLSKLVNLTASINSFTGEIPSSFGNLSSLKAFVVTLNNLEGEIPYSFGHLTRLEVLALGGNRISGTFPPDIFNHTSLTRIDVGNNQIRGTLPSDLGNTLPNLSHLSILGNLFTGSIPASLSNASNLVYLALGNNSLSGEVPSFEKLHMLSQLSMESNSLGSNQENDLNFISSLTNGTKLRVLAIDSNKFGGRLPEALRNLSSSLSWLSLSDNQISGSIPNEIGNFVNLEVLRVQRNQFTSIIPVQIGQLQNLRELNLFQNTFSGKIPESLGNLSLLIDFFLNDNNLHHRIPLSLGNCQNLLRLDLSQNSLNGLIPREIFGISSLISIDLSENQLDGSIPQEVGNLDNLEYLNISRNNLNGVIPSLLGSCIKLEVLIMDRNFLQGVIPSSFISLRGLQILDLSHNNLSGKIPRYFQDFNFQLLNLSFNDFDSELPEQGMFMNSSVVSLTGNPKLCGGVPALRLPKCNSEKPKKFGTSLTLRLIVSAVSGILGIVLVIGFLFFMYSKRTKTMTSSHSFGYPLLHVSYQNLIKATNGFSESNFIGVGGFGSVYKGTLDPGRKRVAVKVLNLFQHGASKSFMAECEALRRIRHRNLIKVLSACSGVDYQGNDFKALIYEFMDYGSLEEWLHSDPREGVIDVEPRELNLVQRLNIAIDIASAIDYLHHQCETPIVHCDIKPSNVLLDNKFVSHISDFGLARFLPITEETHQNNTTCVRGSVGYTAPEHGMGSEISTHGDMYSFGILLLEMFTGKRPTDDMFKDGLDLHSFVQNALPDHVADVVDPILLQIRREDQETANEIIEEIHSHENRCFTKNESIEEILISILKIGISCSAFSALDRKNATDAAAELRFMKSVLLATQSKGDVPRTT